MQWDLDESVVLALAWEPREGVAGGLGGCAHEPGQGAGTHLLPGHCEPGTVLGTLWRLPLNKCYCRKLLIKFYFILTATQ